MTESFTILEADFKLLHTVKAVLKSVSHEKLQRSVSRSSDISVCPQHIRPSSGFVTKGTGNEE